jgi:hypothetical protein
MAIVAPLHHFISREEREDFQDGGTATQWHQRPSTGALFSQELPS